MAIPDQLIAALRQARHVVVLSGAGISAESGLPTFREAQTGLWSRYRPEDLASPEAFRRNPRLVWEWYAWRRELVQRAQPNPAHLALADLERRVPRFTLVTQNVDGLHQRAGSQTVIELHGNLWRVRCSAEQALVDSWVDDEAPPRCPRCRSYLRPDVVWFGESLPRGAMEAAFAASGACDLFLAVGTSGLVQPAATLPYYALEHGAAVGIVNLEPTLPAGPGVFYVSGTAGLALPALLRAAWPARGEADEEGA